MQQYKQGDKVRVWSLQSFFNGGFLEGAEAIVVQDQRGSSVILAVVQNINGEYKLNRSYEAYAKQCEPYNDEVYNSTFKLASEELEKYRKELLKK